MTDKTRPPIADLIARTPGAQTRETAKASIKDRREQLLNTTSDSLSDPAAPEPLPHVDTETYARDFFTRLMHDDKTATTPPPRGGKPRIVIDNDDTPKN